LLDSGLIRDVKFVASLENHVGLSDAVRIFGYPNICGDASEQHQTLG
jgi:hypothetical protein